MWQLVTSEISLKSLLPTLENTLYLQSKYNSQNTAPKCHKYFDFINIIIKSEWGFDNDKGTFDKELVAGIATIWNYNYSLLFFSFVPAFYNRYFV